MDVAVEVGASPLSSYRTPRYNYVTWMAEVFFGHFGAISSIESASILVSSLLCLLTGQQFLTNFSFERKFKLFIYLLLL